MVENTVSKPERLLRSSSHTMVIRNEDRAGEIRGKKINPCVGLYDSCQYGYK